jgi:hypothetical protein
LNKRESLDHLPLHSFLYMLHYGLSTISWCPDNRESAYCGLGTGINPTFRAIWSSQVRITSYSKDCPMFISLIL